MAGDLKTLAPGSTMSEMKRALKACVDEGFMADVTVGGLQCGYEFLPAGRKAHDEMTSSGVTIGTMKGKR